MKDQFVDLEITGGLDSCSSLQLKPGDTVVLEFFLPLPLPFACVCRCGGLQFESLAL